MGSTGRQGHLQQLEAESIHIFREVAAECRAPVMLYSIGKDSTVMLHLARKAFHPAKLPFPVLHIDTGWKFREMIAFRDAAARVGGIDLIVYTNPDGLRDGVNPFDHGPSFYTHVMKTEALKQALRLHDFDAAFGGARRDEEKSRAKERVFSFRNTAQAWDPKNQRPEFWHLYNTRLNPGETLRVFPLSNWTELDIWQYIRREGLDIVPLYFAAERPVVDRDGALIVVDDVRMVLHAGERPRSECVRFRSLGCYPLTAAVRSTARTLDEIVAEMQDTRMSERSGRLIDRDENDFDGAQEARGLFLKRSPLSLPEGETAAPHCHTTSAASSESSRRRPSAVARSRSPDHTT